MICSLILSVLILLQAGEAVSVDNLFGHIEQGNTEQVRLILDREPDLLNVKSADGMTPLNFAAFRGNAEIVGELLELGADINIGDSDNSQPIHCAAISGDTASIKLLLAHGADINSQDNNGMTPLLFAISYRKTDAIGVILERNPDPAIISNRGMNALHYAVYFRQADLVGRLLEAGANPNTRTGQNQTPLLMALYNADYEVAGMLVDHGANVEEPSNDGTSLLYYSLAYRDADFARRILARGENFTQTNDRGMTMLHYAAARGLKDVVEILLDKGVEIDARCTNGKTALYYATIWDHRDVADLLLENNAQPLTDESIGLEGPYFGQDQPGRHPEPFALNKFLTPFAPHGRLVFSPDGTELFWCHHAMPIQAIWYSRLIDGVWQRPTIASFTDPSLDYADGSPCFTYDGNRVYFHSHRPVGEGEGRSDKTDIWYVERAADGWGTPVNLGSPVNTDEYELAPSVSSNGSLYFIGSNYDDTHGEGDIYVAELVDGNYVTPRNLGPAVNSAYHELNPTIAPDGSYIVFSSNRPAPGDGLNLYVSFKKKDGGWTDAVAFSQSITSGNAWHSFITADSEKIIYLRGDNYYWFSTEAVDDLRGAALGPEPDAPYEITFEKSDQDFGNFSTRKIMLADFDGDDDLDAVLSCGQVWLNDGKGNFSLHEDNMVYRGHGVDIGDVDRDGDIDIVLAGYTNPMYLNDGNANFEKSDQMFGDSTDGAFHVLLTDFDTDGDLDMTAFYAGDSIVSFVNDGTGAFGMSDMILPDKYACDLDDDGDIDFFVRKRHEGYKVLVNDGNGNFSEYWNMPDSSIDYGFVAFGDIDNDGDPEVLVTNGGNEDIYSSLILINDGSGRFEFSDMELPCSRWGNVTFGDLNNDGWLDAFLANFTLPNCVLINDGNGILEDTGLRLGGSGGNMISAIGDLDGDGDLDIFVSNFEGGSSEVWFNETK